MSMGSKKRSKSALTAALIAAPAFLLAGCYDDDYYSRRDTITLGAGDAQAVNAATHTVDPWPEHSRNTDIHMEGERAGVAVERYQQNKSVKPKGLTGSKSSGSNKATIQIQN